MSEREDALDVLRGVWSADGKSGAELDEAASRPPKICKNMVNVGFDGLAEPGTDLRDAWKQKLEREGKLNKGAGSVRDLVLGSESPR